MFANSIRWRLQLWLAFLLVCVLTGFGVAVFQLQRVNQLHQIDEQLSLRIAALVNPGPGRPPGEPPFGMMPPKGFEPGKPPNEPDWPDFGHGPGPRDSGPGQNPDENHQRMPPPPDWWKNLPDPGGTNGFRKGFGKGPGPHDMDRGGPHGFGPRDFRLSPDAARLFTDTSSAGYYYLVWGRDGSVLRQATNAPTGLAMPGRNRGNLPRIRTRDSYREAVHFSDRGECLLAGVSIAPTMAALDRLVWLLVIAGSGVLLLGLGGGWWLTTKAIRPVEEMSAAASRISAGNLSERIRSGNEDNELGRLASVLNSTFARLEASFAQQKQFTADASHELRTPLAVLIAEAQSTLARERTAEEYRETVEVCLESGQQIRRLADSLLELARFDAGQAGMESVNVDLAELAGAAAEQLAPLAVARRLTLTTDLRAARVLGDPQRLSRVVTNLLANAIHYNREEGSVRVTTSTEQGCPVLVVEDTGIGIAEEDLPRIFERFYRADRSRARAEGRTGLGLAICKAILDAHKATIEVRSEVGGGSVFKAVFPAPCAGSDAQQSGTQDAPG